MNLTPTVNTYANLQKPKQFRPSEAVTFSCYYSGDLAPSNATLVLYDGTYGYQWYSKPYYPSGVSGDKPFNYIYKQSGYANEATGGIWQIHFEVPAYAIGDEHFNHPEDASWSVNGTIKARIEFGNELDDDGFVTNPYFISNSVYVPLYHAPLKPLYWGGYTEQQEPPETVTSSTFEAAVSYRCYSGGVLESENQINSYRYLLYDEEYNIIYDSKNKFDWISSTYVTKWIRFSNLKNNKTYHAKVKAVLVGGYEIETDYYTFTTDFQSHTISSDKFTLINNDKRGCVEIHTSISANHTKFIFSRCVKNTNEFITLKTINADADFVFKDYMCLPNTEYTYKLDVFNGELLIGTYYNEIVHSIEGICIADIYGAYATYIDVKKYPISKNAREIFQETIGSKYPFGIIPTYADYFKSGSISGVFVENIDDCQMVEQNINIGNAEYCKIVMNWLNNGSPKFLKYDDGFAAIVMKDGDITEDVHSASNNLHTITFSWKEIADKDEADNYIKFGLVGEI